MQIVIDIPEAAYETCKSVKNVESEQGNFADLMLDAIANGTVLTECEDTISREDARMMLTCEIKDGMTITEYIKMVDERLRKLPPVTSSRHVDCEGAEHDGNGCLGYSHYGDDFPIEECLHCPKYTSYEE